MYAMLPGDCKELTMYHIQAPTHLLGLRYELNIDEDLITVSDFERIPDDRNYSSELEEVTVIEPKYYSNNKFSIFHPIIEIMRLKRIKTIATFKKLLI